MSLTNFPNGVSSFGVPMVGAAGQIPATLTGSYYYVRSTTGSDSNEGTLTKPLASINAAVAKCTANAMDVIVCLPGHTEASGGASGIAISTAGVTVVGIGTGSLRPTITLTAAAATIAMSAANTTLDNFNIQANFVDVAVGIITSAKYVSLTNLWFTDLAAGTKNFLSCIATDAVANSSDGLRIQGCHRSSTDTGALATISILEAQDNVTIADNEDYQAYGANVGHFIILGAFEVTNFRVLRNTLIMTGDNSGQSVGNLITGSGTVCYGIVAGNLVGGIDVGGLLDTATLDFQHFENYFAGILAKSGLILPAIA